MSDAVARALEANRRTIDASQIDMSGFLPASTTKPFTFVNNLEGALWWYAFGYRVLPLVPKRKKPAVSYYPWLDDLSEEAIRSHWAQNPTHGVGAVLDSSQIVLDADSPEADEALRRLEQQFNAVPGLIIKTSRGYHHHFRLAEGTFAKADSHFTQDFPDRLDVRAGQNSVMLTPSEGKTILKIEASHRDDLSRVGQDFIDAVFQHNGREAPRPAPEMPDDPEEKLATSTDIAKLTALLEHIDPNCGYQDWLNVLMAIYHETAGSAEGFQLADSWSRRGKSYQGRKDIEVKWRSFRGDVAKPITVATLLARAREAGADTTSIMEDAFQRCKTVVIQPDEVVVAPQDATATKAKVSPLARYSLIGQAAKFEAMAQAATPLLGDMCQRGEATVWYAKHNTGKTLLFLHMALEAIEKGRLAASDLFFINADDSSSGIAVKLAILDELGAHTLVPGQGGFKPEKLEDLLLLAVKNDSARGTLVVIDTLKKFVDLMNKRQASDFANVARQYVAAGGTLLGLAHVNKRKSDDGKAVHAGTTDILDDFDAGYIIDELSLSGYPGQKFVEFQRLKARGGGVQSVAYTYAGEDHVSYAQRLASVRLVDQDDLDGIKRVEAERSDADLIATVVECITAGVDTKMALRNAVADKTNVSRRAATRIIEQYTGDDPAQHCWHFVRKARGAMTYALLAKEEAVPASD
jgi:hypothetical protein